MTAAIRLTPRSDRPAYDFEITFSGEADIVMQRTLRAPRALVWALWTDPDHVRSWWGPHGFENTACEIDLRPGGRFYVAMRTPDGEPCPCEGVFVEIAAPERLVYDGLPHMHPCGSGLPPESRVSVSFAEQGLDTRVTVHARLLSPDRRAAAVEHGFAEGWADCFERMSELLPQGSGEGFSIVTSRRFSASPASLFALFADPAHLKYWWGPDGFTNTIPVFDFQEGGDFRIVMHGPDGRDHDNHKRFVEIVTDRRIVFDHFQPSHRFRMSIDYVPDGAHTDMIWRMDFAPSEHESLLRAFIPQANEQNYDRLEVYLQDMSAE